MISRLPKWGSDGCAAIWFPILGLVFVGHPQCAASSEMTSFAAKSQTSLTVRAQAAEGRPLTNATAVCFGPTAKVRLNGTALEGGGARLETDLQGQFTVALNSTNLFVAIANDEGFCLSPVTDLKSSPTMKLQPWGRISGVRLDHNHPMPGRSIKYWLDWRSIGSGEITYSFESSANAITDAQGRFAFDHVPPAEVLFTERQRHPATSKALLGRWQVYPDKVTDVTIATQARTVVGHLEFGTGLAKNIDFASFLGALRPDVDEHKFPVPAASEGGNSVEKRTKNWDEWYNSDIGRQYLTARMLADLEFHSDGSFIGEVAAPGKYIVGGQIDQNKQEVAVLDNMPVTVPRAASTGRNVPFDIGRVLVKAAVNLKIGDMAPDFSVKTLDGETLNLSSLRGRYVLLDFWATWCDPCVEEMPNLKATYNAFAQDRRFTMVSLSLDPEAAPPGRFVKAHGIGWTQVFLGEWAHDTVTEKYGVYAIPAIFLIGPDGRILATDLRGDEIHKAVATALSD